MRRCVDRIAAMVERDPAAGSSAEHRAPPELVEGEHGAEGQLSVMCNDVDIVVPPFYSLSQILLYICLNSL